MGTSLSTSGVYTITIGTAGEFTNDSQVDMSSLINQDIKMVPDGEAIDLVIEPGNYGIAGTILLPSNTSVIGYGATLTAISTGTHSLDGCALMANADAYAINNQLVDTNSDGTTTTISGPGNSTDTMTTNSSTAIVDSNISIQGLTFNETGNSLGGNVYNDEDTDTNVFGTWFINAKNIEVQDNTYIGGNDGNAFVNVVNGVVDNNIAIGQLAAFDNWDGPVGITVEDNLVWQFSVNEQSAAASVQINSTPTGDPNNPGTASNDAIVDNLFSGNYTNLESATNIWPLPGYSTKLIPTFDITQQGNTDSILNTPDAQGYYMDYTQGSTTEDNIISQAVVPGGKGFYGGTDNNSLIVDVNWGTTQTSSGTIAGNLIVGDYTTNTATSTIIAQGSGSQASNNAILSGSFLSSNGISGTDASGNLQASGTLVLGQVGASPLQISAIPTIMYSTVSPITLSGSLSPFLIDENPSEIVSLTLETQFGSFELPQPNNGTSNISQNNGMTIVLTGNLSSVDESLQGLVYVPNSEGWSDSIKMIATDNAGAGAERYIPILSSVDNGTISSITTIAPGFINPAAIESSLFSGQNLPSPPTFSGNILISQTGDCEINMSSISSLAFLGSGITTLQSGSLDEFIETGSGAALLNLSGSGDVTVAGGSGTLNIDAISAPETTTAFIECGASTASVVGGQGAISVIGGLGSLSFTGGSGATYLATLPESAGDLSANLGTGNSTVYALSGSGEISSQAGTKNDIFLGTGNYILNTCGEDTIFAGSGCTTIDASSLAMVSVSSGTGIITYIEAPLFNAESQTLPVHSDSLTTSGGLDVFGTGNLSIFGTNGSPVEIEQISNVELITTNGNAIIHSSGNNDSIVGGQGIIQFSDDDTPADNAAIVLGGGGGNISLSGGTGNVHSGSGSVKLYANNSVSLNVQVGSGGGDIISENSNNCTITTTTMADSMISVSGGITDNAIINSYGNDTISASGRDTINSYAGAASNVTFSGDSLVCNIGSKNQLGAVKTTVNIDSGAATRSVVGVSEANLFVGGGNLDFINKSIFPQMLSEGSKGSISVMGGAGGGVYYGGSAGNNVLIGGTGVVTLTGGGNNDILQANSPIGVNCLISGPGNEILDASSNTDSNNFIISPGSNVLAQSTGSGIQNFVVQSDCKAATITGSMAAGAFNNILFLSDKGNTPDHCFISDFSSANFSIYLEDDSLNAGPNAAIVSIKDLSSGSIGGALISLSDGSTINVLGQSASELVFHTGSNGIVQIT